MAEKKAETAAEKKTEAAPDIKDIQAQVQAIIDQAKEEAKRIVDQARSAEKGEMSEEERAYRKERENYWNELVEVKLFKDNNKYSDDVFVSVNGDNCLIKRGERVKIKRKFASVLDQSDMQDYETSKLIEKATQVQKIADL